MKLSNIEITSDLRMTQPAGAAEKDQTLDIQFAVDVGAVADGEFYELLFYNLLNGFVTGEDETGVVTGVKAIYYDQNDQMIAETAAVYLDKVMTETGTELHAVASVDVPEDSTVVYITKVDLIYISNNNSTEESNLIFTSVQPQKCAFAEEYNTDRDKGVAIPPSSGTTRLYTDFKLY
jgi:hypothetical protein